MALSTPAALHAEEAYILEMAYRTAGIAESGTSSSSGHSQIVERVVSRDGDITIIEYDLLPDAREEERAHQWQFPMRVQKDAEGNSTLLNEGELTARVDAYLEHMELTREACGKTVFTWNAFTIRCDPREALDLVKPFDLRAGPVENGELYNVEGAAEPTTLRRAGTLQNPLVFTAILPLDPRFIGEQRAQSDLVIAEISGKELEYEQALAERLLEQVHGSIAVTLEIDRNGETVRRSTTTTIVTRSPDGSTETDTNIQTVRRIPLPSVPKLQ